MVEKGLHFLPVPGIRLAAVAAGIKDRDRNDLTVIEVREGATAAAIFTRNAFCAAPVILARENLTRGAPRYLLINSETPTPVPASGAWMMPEPAAPLWRSWRAARLVRSCLFPPV